MRCPLSRDAAANANNRPASDGFQPPEQFLLDVNAEFGVDVPAMGDRRVLVRWFVAL
jgi:hypothetical protein